MSQSIVAAGFAMIADSQAHTSQQLLPQVLRMRGTCWLWLHSLNSLCHISSGCP